MTPAELNALVGKALGDEPTEALEWERDQNGDHVKLNRVAVWPDYKNSWEQAGRIIEQMKAEKWNFYIEWSDDKAAAEFFRLGDGEQIWHESPTAAVCLAFLRAKGVEVPE